jgi:predicted transglutaminase-like cysteine proteinase
MRAARNSSGFNPYIRDRGKKRRSPRALIAALVTSLGLAAALTVGAASPAYAANAPGTFIMSTKSVAAPRGFTGVCEKYAWACLSRSKHSKTHSADQKLDLARKVNTTINRRVREISDVRQYRVAELWALPTRRGGDCEDFALLKKKTLITHGIPAERLLIATVLDRKKRPHAVLVMRTEKGDFILDNQTNRIVPWNKTGYSFLRMQRPDAPSQWMAIMSGGIFDKRPTRLGAGT